MQDSLFTKIINGEIPSHKIYEDEHTYAFLDIHPVTTGHTLVIPKKQIEFIWDLDDETYAHLMESVKKIGAHLRAVLDVKYVGIQVEGVQVPHVHVKLIPFNTPDEYLSRPDMNAEPDHEQLAAVASKISL